MFFCAQATAPTDSANQAIEPPYPFKLLLPKISIPSYQKYVLVRGIVTEDGSVRDVKVIAPAKQETAALLVEALMQWTFRPATRQGTAIPVEFVIAVPAATY